MITAEELTKERGGRAVVSDVTFRCEPGTITVDRGGTVLLSSHLPAEVEAVADRMMIIGGGRIQVQGTRAELLTESGTIVEADDLATLDAVLHDAGPATHPADGGRRSSRPSPRSSPAWRWPTTSCCAGSPRPTGRASNASSSS